MATSAKPLKNPTTTLNATHAERGLPGPGQPGDPREHNGHAQDDEDVQRVGLDACRVEDVDVGDDERGGAERADRACVSEADQREVKQRGSEDSCHECRIGHGRGARAGHAADEHQQAGESRVPRTDHEDLPRVSVDRAGCDPGVVMPEPVVRKAGVADQPRHHAQDDHDRGIDRDHDPNTGHLAVVGSLLFGLLGPVPLSAQHDKIVAQAGDRADSASRRARPTDANGANRSVRSPLQ